MKNPFLNTAVQLVETVHVVEESLKMLDDAPGQGNQGRKAGGAGTASGRTRRGGHGSPRGILFHDYTYDNRGQVVKANCIIPTTQNTQCIDDDMTELVPWMICQGHDEGADDPHAGDAGARLRPVHLLLGAFPGRGVPPE